MSDSSDAERRAGDYRVIAETQDPKLLDQDASNSMSENAPSFFPSDVLFLHQARITEYLKAKFKYLADWETSYSQDLRGIGVNLGFTASEIDSPMIEDHVAYIETVWSQTATGESQRLGMRRAQLPEHVLTERWYLNCTEMSDWLIAAGQARLERIKAYWFDQSNATYRTVVAAGLSQDPSAREVLEYIQVALSKLVSDLSLHLAGGGGGDLPFTVELNQAIDQVSVSLSIEERR